MRSPGKYFLYAGIAVHFYESIAVLGHEAPEHGSLLYAVHGPMLGKTAYCLRI